MSLLAPLGIYGWEEIETPLFACILLGEPVCLVSEPGAGKTYLGEVLSKALGDNVAYGYYDVSKSNFEDFIGFPNPEAFRAGRAEFIHNELTIWDKNVIMLDEISRALRDTSNKWLEVLGSRMLMGKPLPLVAILGAMNPTDHHATHLLDQAFADRFIAFLPVPEYATMDNEARTAILSNSTGLDAPSLQFWSDQTVPVRSYVTVSEEFQKGAALVRSTLKQGAAAYRSNREVSSRAQAYADYLGILLARQGYKVEARRLKMLSRFISAQYAIEPDDLQAIAKRSLPLAFGGKYTGDDLNEELLYEAHSIARTHLEDSGGELLSLSHSKRFARLVGDEVSFALKDRLVRELVADDSVSARMTATALMCSCHHDSIWQQLPPGAWAKINAHAQRPVTTMPMVTAAPALLEQILTAGDAEAIALAYAADFDDWQSAYTEALTHLQRAKEDLLGAIIS